nr:beta-ketoacyl-ACP synthase 3 [Treponema sp.]
MSVSLRSVGVGIPARRVTNEELALRVDTTDEWIRSHTGIGSRHYAADGELTSDLAATAAREALARAGIEAKDIDYLVLATATPDYFGFPSTACIVQDKIGALGCPALDLTAGCTGFIYGLDVARGLLEVNKGKYALVIGAETLSRVINWEDRGTNVLLGDGAGAVVLERGDGAFGIECAKLRADGAGAPSLKLVQAERAKTFERAAPMVPYLAMDGRNVYNFAVAEINQLVEDLLRETGYAIEDFTWIVPHQANARIIRAAAKRLALPEARFYMNIEEYANTSSASIPIALHEMEGKGLL